MDEQEKLALVRSMTGKASDAPGWEDSVLLDYLSVAGRAVIDRAFPYRSADVEEVPDRYGTLQCEIAAYLLNRRGAEGETGHSENGISRQYEDGWIPASMLRRVLPTVTVFGVR